MLVCKHCTHFITPPCQPVLFYVHNKTFRMQWSGVLQRTGPWNAALLTALLLKGHCLYVCAVDSALLATETKPKYNVSFLCLRVRWCSWRSCWPCVTLFSLSGMQALERVRWWGHCKGPIRTWNANLCGWTSTLKLWPMTSCSASSTQQLESGKMVITEHGKHIVG